MLNGIDGVDASSCGRSTPPRWHADAIRGHPPHQCRIAGEVFCRQNFACLDVPASPVALETPVAR